MYIYPQYIYIYLFVDKNRLYIHIFNHTCIYIYYILYKQYFWCWCKEIPLPPCHLHLSSCIGTEVMLRTGMTNPPHIMQHLDKVTWQLGGWVFWRKFCRNFWVLPLTFSCFFGAKASVCFCDTKKAKGGGLYGRLKRSYTPWTLKLLYPLQFWHFWVDVAVILKLGNKNRKVSSEGTFLHDMHSFFFFGKKVEGVLWSQQ